jgi:hypothetical protein
LADRASCSEEAAGGLGQRLGVTLADIDQTNVFECCDRRRLKLDRDQDSVALLAVTPSARAPDPGFAARDVNGG